MDIAPGRVIGDKYRLVRLLGRGSMGEVWAAYHQTLDGHVALKLLRCDEESLGHLEGQAEANARFQFEAQLAARLSQKTRHIVRVTDHGQQADVSYLVMELLEGETLEALLARQRRLELPTLVELVRQIARGLTHAHGEGVAHRDLKPANVFVTRDEEQKLVAKLLDFGIARAIGAHRVPGPFSTATGLIFGTPSYMSPEQARGSNRLDHRCDLWALATIAYQAASGALPAPGQDVDDVLKNLCAGRVVPFEQVAPDLPATLGLFFARAFADSVDDRFQTAAELAEAFERAALVPVAADRDVGEPVSPQQSAGSSAPGSNRPLPVGHRATLLGFIAGLVTLLAAMLVATLAWHLFRARPTAVPLVAGPETTVPTAVLESPAPPADGTLEAPPASEARVAPVAPSASPRSTAPAAPVLPLPSPTGAPARPSAAPAAPTTSAAPTKVDRSEVF